VTNHLYTGELKKNNLTKRDLVALRTNIQMAKLVSSQQPVYCIGKPTFKVS